MKTEPAGRHIKVKSGAIYIHFAPGFRLVFLLIPVHVLFDRGLVYLI